MLGTEAADDRFQLTQAAQDLGVYGLSRAFGAPTATRRISTVGGTTEFLAVGAWFLAVTFLLALAAKDTAA